MTRPFDLAGDLDRIASDLNRTDFSGADPERWHVARNASVIALRRLAKRLRGEPERPDHIWRAPARR